MRLSTPKTSKRDYCIIFAVCAVMVLEEPANGEEMVPWAAHLQAVEGQEVPHGALKLIWFVVNNDVVRALNNCRFTVWDHLKHPVPLLWGDNRAF